MGAPASRSDRGVAVGSTSGAVRSEGESDSSSGSDNDHETRRANSANASIDAAGTGKKVSCQACREAKVKCLPSSSSSSTSCARCLKLDRACVFRTHKRGRKPGKIKLQQILRRLELLDRTLDELRDLNTHVKDADASSLIQTLTWQLHRSKFFTKGAVQPSSTVKLETPPLSTTSPLPTLPPSTWEPRGDMQKSRSDFNMLVDIEDHASVARVPDEFPTLSNPLKLLAQASSDESARRQPAQGHSALRQSSLAAPSRRDQDSGPIRAPSQPQSQLSDDDTGERARKRRRSTSPSPHPEDPESLQAHQAARARKGADGGEGGVDGASGQPAGASASSWASTYFSRGAFHPVYDNRQEFDPIDQGLLTTSQAERLIGSFYASFGTFMHIFDPELSSITYIRKHSAFLLTVLCALAAEFEPPTSSDAVQAESAALAPSLRRHYEAMIGWISAADYKNVEMAQAFFLLASYRPMSESAMADQTWLFLGTAIRIATELGCNLVCYSYTTPAAHANTHYQRQLRNTERLWINLWNLEKTLASQTGQRMHLADEGVIATCSRWHSMPLALRQDEALVAQIELRRIMIAQGDHFNTHVLRSLGARRRVADFPTAHGQTDGDSEAGGDLAVAERDQLSLQLSYFRNSVHMDLKRWEERWLSSSSSSGGTPSPLQITGPLSLDYAALVTYALALPISYSVDVTAELAMLYRHCYISCTNYMATFVDRCQRGYMDHVTNSFVVSTVYAVVFALDLSRRHLRQQRRAHLEPGQNRQTREAREAREVDLGFVSRSRVVNLARLTARELEKIGSARTARSATSIATKYSVFLHGLLARFGREDAGSSRCELREHRERGEAQGLEAQGEGGEDRAAVLRGFSARRDARGEAPAQPEGSRHLRRDHNHPLPQPAGAAGTRASHSYSTNLHFSPHLVASWPQAAPQGTNWTEAPPPPPASTAGAMSPASWFNVHAPTTPAPPAPPATAPTAATAATAGIGGTVVGEGLPTGLDDPQWEWMMKDLDLFAVDGGGGGGEPILDQMGRLFA